MAASTTHHRRGLVLVLSLIVAITVSVTAAVDISAHSLPILFFHGITGSAKDGALLQQNLSTDARPFLALSFCENECSARDLPTQVTMAIDQIRSLTSNDSRFENGYIVIGHSQGGVLARAVIEEMDDHKAHTFISLAGSQNGIFYGPQASDRGPAKAFRERLGPKVLPTAVFNFTNYSDADVTSGKIVVDFAKLLNAQPALQKKISVANLVRSPVATDWRRVNTFLPLYNGLLPDNAAEKDCTRRKRNFLKLEAAHFFGSPADDVLSPWQTALLGKYGDVSNIKTLGNDYAKLKIVSMADTDEFTKDTYGLRTLKERRGLFLHQAAGVTHRCWILEGKPTDKTDTCKFQTVFEKHLFPLLAPFASAAVTAPPNQDFRQQS